MDFGASARDYATHRKGFPPSFFAAMPLSGRVLDIGTGTGSVASGYAQRGARAVGADISLPMLRAARPVPLRVATRAEALPFRSRVFDAVVAGQCCHWFDGPVAAQECSDHATQDYHVEFLPVCPGEPRPSQLRVRDIRLLSSPSDPGVLFVRDAPNPNCSPFLGPP